MKFDRLIILSTLLLLLSCDQYSNNQSKIDSFVIENKYKNNGFSLVYNEKLKIKKIDQRSLSIFHKTLKKNPMLK